MGKRKLRELEFRCECSCDEEAKAKDIYEKFRFKTCDWFALTLKSDGPHSIDEVSVETTCPKCGSFCYKHYSLSDLFYMLFTESD